MKEDDKMKTGKCFAAASAACLAAVSLCSAVSAVPDAFYDELKGLEWGMSLEETMAAVTAEPDRTEIPEETDLMQTNLIYENAEFKGYDATVILCVVEGALGLNGVNFYVPADDANALYDEFAAGLKNKNCVYDPVNEEMSFWHFDEADYTVMLMLHADNVQYSYFPLFSEEERWYSYGADAPSAEDKTTPDTGIADAAVFGGAFLAAGAVLMLAVKKK